MNSNLPNVNASFSNGNLLQDIPVIDGYASFIGTGATEGNLNKVFTIQSLEDAINQGITAIAEPTAYRHLSEFYAELGGNQQCYLFLVANTVTMAQMLDSTSTVYASVLIAAGAGQIGYLGTFRTPPDDYNGGENFMDSDVAAALAASITFIEAQNALNLFFTVIVEGRVLIANEASNTIYAPNTADTNFGGTVIGGSLPDGSASVGCALGRKVAYECQIKIGKVANGPLAIQTIYIGTQLLAAVTNLNQLAGLGYIIFMTYPNKSGFYFGVDYMANTGDYSLWVRAAIIVAAAKIAVDVYINDLEGEVDCNADGTIAPVSASFLEDSITSEINLNLGSRITSFTALVDRTADVLETSIVPISLRVQPKGYATEIDIDLGLTA